MFFKNAMAICIKQAGQFVDLRLEFFAFVGVAHLLAVIRQFNYLRGAEDIGGRRYGLFGGDEWFMLHQLQTAGVINQRVAGYTGGVVICPCETTVDYQQQATGTHRALAIRPLLPARGH